MKKVFILFSFMLFPYLAVSQNEPAAVKILDKFSSAALIAPSVSMEFRLITINDVENTKDTIDGSIIMAGDKYKLDLPDNITWFNGGIKWNYLIAEKEVTITKTNIKGDSFIDRPSAIYTLYKKGYKIRLIEETDYASTIDLYPEDIKSDLVRLRLTIGKSSMNLIRAEYKRKDGIVVYLVVNEYNLRQKTDPSIFSFDNKKYNGAEIIDMR